MQSLPEIRSWKPDVDPEFAEQRVRWLREQILDADRAIAAQQRIISADGPLDAYLLSIESLRDSQRQMESDLGEQMQLREVEVLDFALSGRPFNNYRASAKTLSVFFDSLQRLFERVGQALSTTSISRVVPQPIRNQCELEIAGFFPSSFGIRFTVNTDADFTGHSLSGSALESTFDLVNSENPVEQVALLGNRAMISYRHLVQTLIRHEATPIVAWRTPNGESRHWQTSDNDLMRLANRLEHIRDLKPKILVDTGFLSGASLRRHKFEFTGSHGTITGHAPMELADKVTHNFGKPCTITYQETVFVDETTDQEKRSRVLIDIQ